MWIELVVSGSERRDSQHPLRREMGLKTRALKIAKNSLESPLIVQCVVQICYGSRNEVQRFEEYVYGSSPRFAEEEAEQLNPKA